MSIPLKVLVVDDTATNRQILTVFLKKLSFSVVLAEDGAQAIESFTREQPDLVLMDVMMPVMDGYEATRRIKAMCGERWVPVIFLSALDKEENLVAGLDAGGDDYLHKPVNFVILDAKLRSLIRTLDLQRRLDEARRRIGAITDTLVDGVITIDETGSIQWANPAVEAIFGYPHGELMGHNVNMLMPEPYHSKHDGFLASYIGGGTPHIIGRGQRLVSGRRKDGSHFPMELGVSEMQVDGRRNFVGVVRDVTQRVEAQHQIEENARRLQDYHDVQEAEHALADDILKRQMLRQGLSDPAVQHWVAPTAHFSGDIVAATRCPQGKLYVMLADATGHGLGAAICTLPVLSVFYSLAETGAELGLIINEVNRQLLATMPVGRFVAAGMVCIALDHTAQCWLGGMPDMLLIGADGKVKESLRSEHLPLGVIELDAEETRSKVVSVTAGDQFVLFSDGLIEAGNAAEIQFGLDGLMASLASAQSTRRLEAVQNALLSHMGTGSPHDDVSLMIINC
jgi:PAS domain S-box-containing protein